MTTVFLVEEHTVVRRSLRMLLDAEDDLQVCAGVGTLTDAVDGSWEADVVIHELLLPDCSGPEVVTHLRARFPAAGLVVLSRLNMPTYVHLALTSGADGYVLKSAEPQELLDAVRRVAGGQGYLQPSLGAALARWDEIPRRHGRDSLFSLTTREQEVLELLALGHTNAEVAKALGVALRTVESHRTHLMQKLGLHSRAELVRLVAEQQQQRPSEPAVPDLGRRVSRSPEPYVATDAGPAARR
jgi:two-component system, NarL family, response regulator NreC